MQGTQCQKDEEESSGRSWERMYKVLLVEDEDEVRQGIAQLVDWQSCGFRLCGQAAGGLEGIQLAGEHLPDVVITDICMPYVDGLAMIKRLRQMYPMIKYVILSGHDDFEFAQEALRYNVLDYILKPVAAQGMTELLHRIKQRLDAEFDSTRNVLLLEKKAQQNSTLQKQMAVMELISGNYAPSEEFAGELAGLFPAYLGVLGTDKIKTETLPDNALAKREDLLNISILELMQESVKELGGAECLRYKGRYLALLPCNEAAAVAHIDEIQQKLLYYHRLPAESVVYGPIKDTASMAAAYQKAVLLLETGRVRKGGVFLSESREQPEPVVPGMDRLQRELTQLVCGADQPAITAYFQKLKERIFHQEVSLAEVKILLGFIQTALMEVAASAGLAKAQVYRAFEQAGIGESADLVGELDNYGSLAAELGRLVAQAGAGGDRDLVEKIKEYIQESYGDKDLSVEQVCSRFRISATQFTLLFKRETGTSFLQYVLDLRIKTAKQRLLETNAKIYQIAEDTGFGDAGYFSYCFKQRCGITPKDYRKR